MLQSIMRFLSTVITLYMIAILIRVVMTWFGGMHYGRFMEVLQRITDPYLNVFRGMRFLQIGNIDFSPVVAIIALSILSNIFVMIGYAATITLGIILAMIVSALADAAGFFLILFLILTGIRLIGMLANANTAGRFWIFLDQLLEPITHKLVEKLTHSSTNYRNALLLFAGLIVVTLFVGGFLVDLAVVGLQRLPV